MTKFCALTCRPTDTGSQCQTQDKHSFTSEHKTKWISDILGNCSISLVFRNVESGFSDYQKFTAWTSFFHPQYMFTSLL